jgi:aminoglycoside 9-adenylyltransferase
MDFKNRKELLEVFTNTLGENILGTYLYGSLVQGGARPQSDIDIFVILKKRTEEASRKALISSLLKLSSYPVSADGVRPLEVTLVVKDEISPWRHPAKRDLIFGEWLRPSFESGSIPPPSFDPDLTLILAQVRNTHIRLFGAAATDLIPEISDNDIRKAIRDSLPILIDLIKGDERNVILTLARMLATAETGKFYSKDQAVDKILETIPAVHREILLLAKAAYLGLKKDSWSELSNEVDAVTRYMESLVRSKVR